MENFIYRPVRWSVDSYIPSYVDKWWLTLSTYVGNHKYYISTYCRYIEVAFFAKVWMQKMAQQARQARCLRVLGRGGNCPTEDKFCPLKVSLGAGRGKTILTKNCLNFTIKTVHFESECIKSDDKLIIWESLSENWQKNSRQWRE